MSEAGSSFRLFIRWFRQRKLLQVLAVYLGASWIILEVTSVFVAELGLPRWFFPAAVILLLIGLAVIVSTAIVEGGPATAESAGPEALPKEILAGRLPTLTWPRAILGGLLAFTTLAAVGAVIVFLGSDDEAPIAAATSTNAVAVLPFRTTGESLEVWREGLMDVLAANFDDVGDLRAIDSRAVLNRWRSRIGERDATVDEAIGVARELGARWAIHGQAVELGGQVRIDVSLHAAESGEVIASADVAGAPEAILALTEELTLELLRGLGQEQGLSAAGRALTTTSLDAVKPFLEGEQAMRRSQFAQALESFEEALAIDSTFAMAAYRLSSAYGWQQRAGAPEAIEAAERALRFADKLSPRARGLLEFNHLLEQGRIDAIDAAQQLSTRYPDDPEVWFALGEAYYHIGWMHGIAFELRANPFERALALDSSFLAPVIHLIDLAAWTNDLESLDRYSRYYLAYDSTSEHGRGVLAAHSLIIGSSADSMAALDRLSELSTRSLGALSLIVWGQPDRTELMERVIAERVSPRHPSSYRANGLWNWLSGLETWRGRPSAASAALRDAETLLGANATPILYYEIVNFIYASGDPDQAAQAIVRAEREGLFSDPEWRRVLAHYRLATGDIEGAIAEAETIDLQIDSIRASGDSLGAMIAEGLALGVRGLVAADRGDHNGAISMLRRSIPLTSGYDNLQEIVMAQLWVMAGSLAELGEEEEALRILEGFNIWFAWDAPAAFARAQIYERRGEREKAIQSYSRVVELWRDCDPELRPTWEAAQRALQRLVSES